MKTNSWLKYFDEKCEKFHWVFTQYGFENLWDELMTYREMESRYKMEQVLTEVWFRLPEGIYATSADPGQVEMMILITE